MRGRCAAAVGLLLLAFSGPATAATGCRGATLLPTQHNLNRLARATRCLIAEVRATHGVPPLRQTRTTHRIAVLHSAEMVRRGFFGSSSAGGEGLLAQLRSSGLRSARLAAGEDIAFGTGRAATPQQIVAALMRSAPHRKLLLERRFLVVGVGVALGIPGKPNLGATYTLLFATRR
jgi:uncharacterized protein YkwD